MEKLNSTLKDAGLEPISCDSILYYYAPLKGCGGFVLLGSQMLSPELYENLKFLLIPRVISLTNGCLATSLMGSSLYMYSRPHMQGLVKSQRIAYSVFGSGLFNLGSVLGWALCRSVLVKAGEEGAGTGVWLRAIVGAAGAAGALALARGYIQHVDNLAITKSKK